MSDLGVCGMSNINVGEMVMGLAYQGQYMPFIGAWYILYSLLLKKGPYIESRYCAISFLYRLIAFLLCRVFSIRAI